jgi:ariadne-1
MKRNCLRITSGTVHRFILVEALVDWPAFRDLERAVEDLSELLESPIEPETIPTLRQSVTNKTVYVQKRNEIVLEDTANGFLEGRWRWNVAVEGFDDPEE